MAYAKQLARPIYFWVATPQLRIAQHLKGSYDERQTFFSSLTSSAKNSDDLHMSTWA